LLQHGTIRAVRLFAKIQLSAKLGSIQQPIHLMNENWMTPKWVTITMALHKHINAQDNRTNMILNIYLTSQ
jgi:hypothetical protein